MVVHVCVSWKIQQREREKERKRKIRRTRKIRGTRKIRRTREREKERERERDGHFLFLSVNGLKKLNNRNQVLAITKIV